MRRPGSLTAPARFMPSEFPRMSLLGDSLNKPVLCSLCTYIKAYGLHRIEIGPPPATATRYLQLLIARGERPPRAQNDSGGSFASFTPHRPSRPERRNRGCRGHRCCLWGRSTTPANQGRRSWPLASPHLSAPG